MKVVFKSFREDVKNMFHHLADSQCFRTTGDCTVYNPEKMKN